MSYFPLNKTVIELNKAIFLLNKAVNRIKVVRGNFSARNGTVLSILGKILNFFKALTDINITALGQVIEVICYAVKHRIEAVFIVLNLSAYLVNSTFVFHIRC